MWRVVLEPLVFFLVPFALYALYLKARSRSAFVRAHWPNNHVSIMVVIGLAAAVASVLFAGVIAHRYQGSYVPAHMEDGKLVPGRLQ
jgi:hypothetical protein